MLVSNPTVPTSFRKLAQHSEHCLWWQGSVVQIHHLRPSLLPTVRGLSVKTYGTGEPSLGCLQQAQKASWFDSNTTPTGVVGSNGTHIIQPVDFAPIV